MHRPFISVYAANVDTFFKCFICMKVSFRWHPFNALLSTLRPSHNVLQCSLTFGNSVVKTLNKKTIVRVRGYGQRPFFVLL